MTFPVVELGEKSELPVDLETSEDHCTGNTSAAMRYLHDRTRTVAHMQKDLGCDCWQNTDIQQLFCKTLTDTYS